MPHTSRNFVVAYVLLVGLPLLGLAGVLRSGRSLVAPISIDGTWKVEGDTGNVSNQSCGKTVSSLVNTTLLISQSGKSLALTFDNPAKTAASGILDGKNLKASIGSQKEACRVVDQIKFRSGGQFDPKPRPANLNWICVIEQDAAVVCARGVSMPFANRRCCSRRRRTDAESFSLVLQFAVVPRSVRRR